MDTQDNAGTAPLDSGHWQERLSALASEHRVPGAQLGLLRLGAGAADEEVSCAHGILNAATGQPVSTDALFQIGSITKVWTATAVLQLADAGALDIDAPVTAVLPGFALSDPAAAEALTVRHLLTHTGGIDGDLFTDTGRGDDAVSAYTAALSEAAVLHAPGATWSYCNSGFSVLGSIIEELTGQTWDAAIRERLFAPLGLERTSTLPEEAILHAVAVGHMRGLPDPQPAPFWALPRGLGPAGCIAAPVGELLRFARLHLTGGLAPDGTRILSAESAAAMAAHQADVPVPNGLGDSWGLGWIRFDWPGGPAIGHDGSTVGQDAFLRLVPEAGAAIALLTNGGGARDLADALFAEAVPALSGAVPDPAFAPPAEPVSVDPAPYLGRYAAAAMQLDVTAEGGRPRVRIELLGPSAAFDPDPIQEHALTPVADGVFALRLPGQQRWSPLTFSALETGERYAHFGARALPFAAG